MIEDLTVNFNLKEEEWVKKVKLYKKKDQL